MTSFPALPELLKGLIETPSISSTNPALDMSNRPVIDLLAGWMEDSGFSVQIVPVVNASPTAQASTEEKVNLIGTLGSGSGGLILSGHTDTVPYDENRWSSDPFKLTDADNRYYGLGTADMKSFLGLAIAAARSFDPRSFRHPLMILATSDEETTMAGAAALSAQDLEQGRYAVIGEPTGLKPISQHKGILMESIRLIGQSGHSSNPEYGNNALEGMHEVISRLMEYRRSIQQKNQNPAFEIPTPTMNFGHIHGGDNPNRICGECELQIDLRPLPGMDLDKLRKDFREIVTATAKARNLKCEFTQLFAGVDAMQTKATSPIVKAGETLTGFAQEAVAFGTEGPYLNKLGIDTVILGPGNIAQAHQPNEYLAHDQIEPTLDLLKKLIHQFCCKVG